MPSACQPIAWRPLLLKTCAQQRQVQPARTCEVAQQWAWRPSAQSSQGLLHGSSLRPANAAPSLVPPPIDGDLQELQEDLGASFGDDGVALTFGNDIEAVKAARSGLAVVDQSHFGRIRVYDVDRIRFLHNQTTADFNSLKPGQGCDTTVVTNTARTVDLATAYVKEESVLLVVSPGLKDQLLRTFDKYIFPSDKVQLADVTSQCSMLSVIGPQSCETLESMGAGGIIGQPYGTHAMFQFEGNPVMVAVGSGLALEGCTVIADSAVAGSFWAALLDRGGVPMGQEAWEQLRIQQGRPKVGAELTDDYNALEAGVWRTISTTKGCYIGQETIARLITYNGVKQQLWGMRLEGPVKAPAVVTCEDQKVGVLSSCTKAEDGGYIGLAYVKTKAGGKGLHVLVDGVKGIVVDLPYLAHELELQQS